jgi:hypothetical protein
LKEEDEENTTSPAALKEKKRNRNVQHAHLLPTAVATAT